MLQVFIVHPSSTPYSFPLQIVPKSDQQRNFTDFRNLKEETIPDKYPILHLRDFTICLQGTTTFQKLYLIKGYYKISGEKDIRNRGVITSFGLYEFRRIPFLFRKAAKTFKRFIDEVFRGLTFAFAFACIDHVLVVSRDHKEHQHHKQNVFERLTHFMLKINVNKCDFAVSMLNLLRHVIVKHEITPIPE